MSGLRQSWEHLRGSLWFLPSVLVAGAVGLASLLIELEGEVSRAQLIQRWPRLFGTGAEGARGMLGAIATSMITVTGVVFSITIVTFALASSQYTSRILRTFMRDRANQTVLGVFLGVFTYCLIVLRTIRGGADGLFVPSLAVLGAVLLTLVGVGFLVFFIHHIAESIQASAVVAAVADETIRAIDHLYPSSTDSGPKNRDRSGSGSDDYRAWVDIPSHQTGYIQKINYASLLAVARGRQTVIRLEKGVGDFIIRDSALASAPAPLDEATLRKVNSAITAGRHRTIQEDPAFGIRQLVDMALKALSPAVNDTTTAVICVDYLGAVLVRLATRRLESEDLYEDGLLRVINRGPTFSSLVSDAFVQIRQNARNNPAVLARQVETLTVICRHTRDPDRLGALREQAAATSADTLHGIESAPDRVPVEAALKHFLATVGSGDAGSPHAAERAK